MSTGGSSIAAKCSAPGVAPVRCVGTGPVHALIVHGWIADHTLFDPFIDLIDRERFSCALPDCRGYGSRRNEPGPRTIAAVAEEARALVDRLGWTRFHVVGHSMGGMVAQRLMIDLPERLASVVLLAPVPAGGARLTPARRAYLQRAITEPEGRRDLIEANTGRSRPLDWIERVLQLSLRTTRAEALADYLESWSGLDFSREVRDVEVPVQLILGELDPTAPLARMQETILRWHPRTTLHRLVGVGHYPMIEAPDVLYRLIAGHLAAS